MMRLLFTAISFLAVLAAALLGASPAAAQFLNAAPGGFQLIATISANNTSPNLAFSGANWSTRYNTLFLNCEGLVIAKSNDAIGAYIGEGSGPTWEDTSSNYASTQDQKATDSGDIFDEDQSNYNTTLPVSMKFWIHNPGSSTVYKMVDAIEYGVFEGSNGQSVWVQAWWYGDTNPMTGFELSTQDGNIKSGTCSLYGMN
jgi:hypothetical protein